MSLAKGLSSGTLPIAAVVLSGRGYRTIADEAHRLGVFGNGFTYSGHPVTAAVAAEALRIYRGNGRGRAGEEARRAPAR